MKNRAKWFVCVAVILAAALFLVPLCGMSAQETVKPAAPETKVVAPEAKKEATVLKLPDGVALELRTEQLKLSNLVIDYQRTVQSLAQVRKAVEEQEAKVLLLQGAALKKSGLDPGKFELNPDTLEVNAKPEKKPAQKEPPKQ